MPSIRLLVPLLAAAMLLSACETPPRARFSEMTFSHLGTIDLDVAEIEVLETVLPPQPPRVGNEFPVPPLTAARQWVKDRLRAVGTDGKATVTIQDATAVEERLPVTRGVSGLFTTDQSERYTVRVAMHITAVRLGAQRRAEADAHAVRARTVLEDVTLADRQRAWFEMTESVMADFDRTFTAQIREHLRWFLR